MRATDFGEARVRRETALSTALPTRSAARRVPMRAGGASIEGTRARALIASNARLIASLLFLFAQARYDDLAARQQGLLARASPAALAQQLAAAARDAGAAAEAAEASLLAGQVRLGFGGSEPGQPFRSNQPSDMTPLRRRPRVPARFTAPPGAVRAAVPPPQAAVPCPRAEAPGLCGRRRRTRRQRRWRRWFGAGTGGWRAGAGAELCGAGGGAARRREAGGREGQQRERGVCSERVGGGRGRCGGRGGEGGRRAAEVTPPRRPPAGRAAGEEAPQGWCVTER